MMSFYTEQESAYKSTAIIGAGAAGGLAAVLLCKNPYNKVMAFDIKEPFTSLLPTGGGRCNITNAQNDIKEYVTNYPRGNKFLISVFSRFNYEKTIQLFDDLGIKTYIQDDKRVFPITNSAAETVKILRKHLNIPNFSFKKEKVISVEKKSDKFTIYTKNNKYDFDNVILATGGKGNGFELAKNFGHTIVECRPSLCSLDICENYLYELSGLSFKDIEITPVFNNKKQQKVTGDILFSHKSITGPVVFKISALNAYTDFSSENPLKLKLKPTNKSVNEIETFIKNNSKKSIKNVFSAFVPESYISVILKTNNINGNKQTAQITKQEKEILINSVTDMEINAISRIKNSEIVTAGGIDVKEINSKTMESKIIKNLYCIGEILNIDGFTGGFNLQNCWANAYLCSLNI